MMTKKNGKKGGGPMTYEKKLTLCTAKVASTATAVACLAAIFVVNIILGCVFPSYYSHFGSPHERNLKS